MNNQEFNEEYEKGCKGENFLSKWFSNRGFSVMAGNINGEMINTEIIEEIFNCEYIPPGLDMFTNKKHGPRVLLNGVKYTLPDLLLRKIDSDDLFWVESKLNTNAKYQSVDIPCERFAEYWNFRTATRKKVWICIILVNKNKCKVFSGEIDAIYDFVLFDNKYLIEAKDQAWGRDCYRINTKWSCFTQIYAGDYE